MGSTCSCDTCRETNYDNLPQKRKIEPMMEPKISVASSESDSTDEPYTDKTNDRREFPDGLAIDQKTRELLMKIDNTIIPSMSGDEDEEEEENEEENIMNIQNDFVPNKPMIKKVTTDDRDIAPINDRLNTMYEVTTFDELQNVIGKNYDTDGKSESDHSDLDETDKLEIETRKSNNTPTKVTVDTFEQFHDMKQQLLDLTRQATEQEIKSLHKSNQLSQEIVFVPDIAEMEQENDGELMVPPSNLFRGPSRDKWETGAIEKTKGEMERQMMMLAAQNRAFMD